MKFFFIIFLFLLILLLNVNKKEKFNSINHTLYIYKIFNTNNQIRKGLMFKKNNLPKNSAALFIFNKPVSVSFWMKNTYIPLDIIYLDADYKVLKIYENTIPLDIKKKYKGKNVKYALEVNAGTVFYKNIKVNDKIKLI